jgi:hypothetical protein
MEASGNLLISRPCIFDDNAEVVQPACIMRVTPQGVQTVVLQLSGLTDIFDLALDGEGNLYYLTRTTNPIKAELFRIATNGEQASLWSSIRLNGIRRPDLLRRAFPHDRGFRELPDLLRCAPQTWH